MRQLTRNPKTQNKYPEKVLQFGEGNFLRCFVDWQIDILNETSGLEAGVVVVRPIDTDFPPSLNTQDGVYTTIIRGYDRNKTLKTEKRIISCVNRELSVYKDWEKFLELATNQELKIVVSNTTEAGIIYDSADSLDDSPPSTFPAKLTRFLFERFKHFKGDASSGLVLLPCELIDYNGEELKRIILQYAKDWKLSKQFIEWLENSNTFCSTLVDRIVTGYPAEDIEEIEKELGYKDAFLTTGENFHLFVIQGPQMVKDLLKIEGSNLNIQVVEDIKPFKLRKVGILNGCHTALVPVAFLAGIDLVKDAVEDEDFAQYLSKLLDEEIIPNLDLPKDYLNEYATTVIDRFRNPFIKHELLSISLNSMTKFKTRLLPQFVKHYAKKGTVPKLMSFALAALICFYRGVRNNQYFPLKDSENFLTMYKELWAKDPKTITEAKELCHPILGLEDHWDISLLSFDGLLDKVAYDVYHITQRGTRSVLKEYL